MPDHDLIQLPHLARELVAGGFSARPVEYHRLYRGVLSGLFPAKQVTTNRWSVRRADLPAVASALGLMPSQVEKPSRARRSSATVEHVPA